MKFYFTIIILSLLAVGTVKAQHINLGIKGGLNVYNIDGNSQYKSKAGLNLGVLGHIHLTDKFALQPELYYSSQGAKTENPDININLNYLNVPVLFQYMFDNGFRIQAGPQLGFLASAKTKSGDVTVDVSDAYKGIDFGLGFGGSYVDPATGFGIDARYNHGLSKINESGSAELKNRGFQLGVFYLFKHKN